VIGWHFALRSLIPDAFYTVIWTFARISTWGNVRAILEQRLPLQPDCLGACGHG
jgi:hypothetical protein